MGVIIGHSGAGKSVLTVQMGIELAAGHPILCYVHTWEVDPDQPRMRLPITKRLRHYTNLSRTAEMLDHLVRDFHFTTIREALHL